MTPAVEDAWPVRAAVMGAAVGLSLGAAVIAVADHLLRRIGRYSN